MIIYIFIFFYPRFIFVFNCIYTYTTDRSLVCDVFYLNPIIRSETPYILVLIDGYLIIIPPPSVKASFVVPLFKRMLNDNIHNYRKIFTDEKM